MSDDVMEIRPKVDSDQCAYDLGYSNPALARPRVQFMHQVVCNAYRCGQLDAQNHAPRNSAYRREDYDEAFERRAPIADERAALQKLVDLEDMRLRLRNLHESGHGTDYYYYHQALSAAWDAARAALASAPVADLKDWRIDTSAGGPILVYKDCSVIESDQAAYVLRLISADQASAPVAGEAQELAEALRDWHGKGDGITTTIPDELAQALYGYLHAAPQASDAMIAPKQEGKEK